MVSRRETICVINPNSNVGVTSGIAAAVESMGLSDLPVQCHTLEAGPHGVQSQMDADLVLSPLLLCARELESGAAAVVIACFSDPGLNLLREQLRIPVLGIAECGVFQALSLGQRFGVISILSASIPRHLRYFGAMGVLGRLAGDRAVGLTVAELADEARTFDRMAQTGAALRDQDGAESIVMGCAGMARYRKRLESELGIPVVEPVQAAVGMAIGRVLQDRMGAD